MGFFEIALTVSELVSQNLRILLKIIQARSVGRIFYDMTCSERVIAKICDTRTSSNLVVNLCFADFLSAKICLGLIVVIL